MRSQNFLTKIEFIFYFFVDCKRSEIKRNERSEAKIKMSFTITQEQIIDYIKDGNLKKIKFLKEFGYDFTQKNMFIVLASGYGHLEIVKYFVDECGCDPKVGNNRPIEIAAFYGYLEIVKYLIEECECDPEIARKYTTNEKIIEYLDSLKEEVEQNKTNVKEQSETNTKEQIKTKLNEILELLNQN